MNKKLVYVYIIASLALLVPPPGRFVYGLSLVLELNFLMLLGTGFSFFLKKFNLGQVESPLYLVLLVSATVLYKQIFIIAQTGIAMTLGFDFYLPAVSSFLICFLHDNNEPVFVEKLKANMLESSKFSGFALCFYLFRDVVGYGTFTFFGKNYMIYEKTICNPERTSVAAFFATIPGALVLCAAILFVYVLVSGKMRILKRANLPQGDE